MKNNTEKRVGFKKAFYGFHKCVRRAIKDEIMDYTGWSHKTFYNKMNHATDLSPAEAAVIGLLFKERGVDAWTGKTMQECVNAIIL